MISVILAGGKGLRLWPESRRQRPKQLCRFVDNKTMLEHTIDRLSITVPDKIIIITSDELKREITDIVSARSDNSIIEIISEPEGRNTAPAVGLILSRYHNKSDDVIGFFPADHHVINLEQFKTSIERAYSAACSGHLVTIGINPDRPETGYGYIEKTRWEIGNIHDVYQVNSFYEKPDLETARSYLDSGQHMWNSGIYIARTSTLMREFQQHLPEVFDKILAGPEAYLHSYHELPNISLDYGIAEKSKRMAVVPSDFGWCDLGSWNALADLYEHDDAQNICTGNDIVVLESKNCVVKQGEKTVVLFGVENLLVVESDGIVLVADRKKGQDVRTIVDTLSQLKRQDLL